MRNKPAKEMMYFDYESILGDQHAFDCIEHSKKLIKIQQDAMETLRNMANQLQTLYPQTITMTFSMEELCKTPEDVMQFMLWALNKDILVDETHVEFHGGFYELWHGDTLLRSYKNGDKEITCFFEEKNLTVPEAVIRKIFQ